MPRLRPSISPLIAGASAWAWSAVLLASLLCAGLAWLHFAERRFFATTLTNLDRIRQARLQLAHGFLDLTLAEPNSPWVSGEGLTKVDGALRVLAEIPEGNAAPAETRSRFSQALTLFQEELTTWQREVHANADATRHLRTGYHALELATDSVTASMRGELDMRARSLDRTVYASLAGGLLLLLAIAGGARESGTRHRRADQQRLRAEDALRSSEENLRGLTDAMPQIVWISGADGRTLYMNRHALALAGANPEANWTNIIHPEDQGRVASGWTTAFATGSAFIGEMRMRSGLDGSYRWFLARGVPMNYNGRELRWYCTATDIDEQKTNEAALRESEERYRRLVELLPHGIFINVGGQVRFCNPGFLSLVGARGATEVLDRDALSFFSAKDHETIRARIRRVLGSRQSAVPRDFTIVRLDGRLVPVQAIATPITYQGEPGILVALNNLTERRRVDERLRLVMENTADGIITIDSLGHVTSTNRAANLIFGYAADEMLGHNISRLMTESDGSRHNESLRRYLGGGEPHIIGQGRELQACRKDGAVFPIELTVTEFELDGERCFIGMVRDISERKKLEAQLQQSQKMEAVGKVAGGVAHDFNNLLTVISGYSEMLLQRLPADDPAAPAVRAISKAGELAAGLTRQLLAFSRRTVLELRVLDLNALVTETEKLLRRVIGEDIQLTTRLAPDLWPVRADATQFVQVLMNLVVNARDAMPTGGALTISTSNVDLAPTASAAESEGPTGPRVRLSVSDTGAGMTAEVRDRIFEPFFTTKGVGQGTGLGLAVVHGLVKQSGGGIFVESVPGRGTTFHLDFPRTDASAEALDREASGTLPMTGSETILLVEDHRDVATLATNALEAHGYHVLYADNGPAALDRAAAHVGPIHLLLTDVVMPNMSGRELAEQLGPQRPEMGVLYVSGFTDDAILRHGVQHAEVDFLPKPYLPTVLLHRVRQVLDRASAGEERRGARG